MDWSEFTALGWEAEWPKHRGYYWFIGWYCWSREYPAELHFVKVRYDSTGKPTYVTNGYFLYKEEGGEGVWLRATPPAMPPEWGCLYFQDRV